MPSNRAKKKNEKLSKQRRKRKEKKNRERRREEQIARGQKHFRRLWLRLMRDFIIIDETCASNYVADVSPEFPPDVKELTLADVRTDPEDIEQGRWQEEQWQEEELAESRASDLQVEAIEDAEVQKANDLPIKLNF